MAPAPRPSGQLLRLRAAWLAEQRVGDEASWDPALVCSWPLTAGFLALMATEGLDTRPWGPVPFVPYQQLVP